MSAKQPTTNDRNDASTGGNQYPRLGPPDVMPPGQAQGLSRPAGRSHTHGPLDGHEGRVVGGVVLISVAMVAIAAWVNRSPGIVLGSSIAALALAWSLLRPFFRRRRDRLEDWIRQSEAELDAWYRRWATLRTETQQNTSALSLMRDGVIMLSLDRRIVLVNPSARRLLHLSPDQDLYSRPFPEVVRNPEITQAVESAANGHGTQILMVEIKDGDTIRPVRIRIERFTTAGDNSLLITLRDESEAHRLEAMRREFVANVSHELKTPLAAIKGYAETVELAIQDDPAAATHFMNQIREQCLRLERLVADMMTLARAQSGLEHLDIAAVPLAQVINESMDSYRPVAESKGVSLVVHDADVQAIVRSDIDATLTIANNLIGNALNYTPAGGRVEVTCRPAGEFWALVVEDTGVGIAEAEQARVFERFYRVDKGRSAQGGTGVGLSIVKNLTQALGGQVRLESEPGKGSKFEVLLPKA